MKNTIIKFLIATLLLPALLSIMPAAIASEIHELQHDSSRTAGIQHFEHTHDADSSSDHSHAAFAHDKSHQHPVFLDLNSYFSDYLNVDLCALPEGSVAIGEPSDDISSLFPVDFSYSNLGCYTNPSASAHEDPPHLPPVLSRTMRLRI